MRRGNLLTLRKFFNWKSTWCSKYFYKSLLYKDLFIHFYINSLFFKLRFNTSSININYFNTYINICTFDIYVNAFSRLKKYYRVFFKKILVIYRNLKVFLLKFKPGKISIYKNIKKHLNIDLYYIIRKYTNNFYLFIFNNYIKELYLFYIKKYVHIFKNFNIMYDFHKNDIIKNLNFFFIKNEYNYESIIYFKKKYTIASNQKKKKISNFFLLKNSFILKNKYNILNSSFYFVYNYIKNNFLCINDILFKITSILFSVPIVFLKFFKLKNIYNAFYFKNILINNNKFSKLKFKNKNIMHSFTKIYVFFNFLRLNLNLVKKDYVYKKVLFIKSFFKIKRKLHYIVKCLNKKKYTFIIWFFTKIWIIIFNHIYLRYKLKLNVNYLYLFDINFKLKKQIYNFILSFNTINKNTIYFYKNINFLIKLKSVFKIFTKDIKDIKFKRFFKIVYFNNFIENLIFLIEKSLYFFNNKNINYILLPNIFFFHKPFITSAKLLSDYLYFKLRKKLNIIKTYNKIKKWQLAERSLVTSFIWNSIGKVSFFKKKRYVNFLVRYKKQLKINLIFQNSINIRIPLKGVRCLCTGPAYKARRKTRNFYHLWIANYNITGSMPLQQLRYKIDYYQTFIVLKRATIGLRIWLLLESYIVLK